MELNQLTLDLLSLKDEVGVVGVRGEALATKVVEPETGSTVEHSTPAALTLSGIIKTFGRPVRFELSGLDLTVRYGQITAVVGTNASGKTTTLDIARGKVQPKAGKIKIDGEPVMGSQWARYRSRITFVSTGQQEVYGTVRKALHVRAAGAGISGQANLDEVEWILHRLGLAEFEDAEWRTLSSGYQMRFALADALLSRPTLLILDEPLAHLDIITQQVFLSDLRKLARDSSPQFGVLLTSQHLVETEAVASNILFLDKGKILFSGPPSEIGTDGSQVFEVATEATLEELTRALPRHVEVSSSGLYYVLETEQPYEISDLSESLQKARLKVASVRDISNSTLRILRTSVQLGEQ